MYKFSCGCLFSFLLSLYQEKFQYQFQEWNYWVLWWKWKSLSCVRSDSLWPHGLYSPWNSLGQNTGVGNLSFLQGIFPIQWSNPGLPHCRWILYQLSHKGSPGPMVTLCLTFWCWTFPRWLHYFIFSSLWGFQFLYILVDTCYCWCFWLYPFY